MQATPTSTAALPYASPSEKLRNADWLSAAPDVFAFVAGLAVARWAGWTTTDLIWSLWLSSFVVGSATILWVIGSPSVSLAILAWKTRHDPGSGPHEMRIEWALIFFGALFVVGFFALPFSWLHLGDADLLFSFLPIRVPGMTHPDWGDKAVYLELWRRYWIFLPSAFLSHRAVFLRTPLTFDRNRLKSIFAGSDNKGSLFAEPYKNVLRMHFVIFGCCFVNFAGLENFVIYTVIYSVYFFPWRLVRGESKDSVSSTGARQPWIRNGSPEVNLEALAREALAASAKNARSGPGGKLTPN